MASTTVTWSPTSLQLRLALNCQSSSCNSPSVLVRSRFKKLNRPVHLRCFGPSAGRRRGCSLSIRSESNAESFSGWSESGNDGEQSIESQKKGGLGGIVQAGVAGVVLFAGLTFAALSLSKRSTSRPREQMEPLTAAQDVSIVPDHKIDKFEEYGYAGNNVKQDDRSLESKIGTDNALSSSSEAIEVASDNKIDSENETPSTGDVSHSSSGINSINDVAKQDDLQRESASDDMSVAPDTALTSPKLPEPEVVSGTENASPLEGSDSILDANLPESASEITGENPIDVEPSSFSNPTDLGNDGSKFSRIFSDSSSISSSHAPIEPLAAVISVSSDTTVEPQILPKGDTETVASPSTIKNVEQSEKPLLSGEDSSSSMEVHDLNKNGSSGTSVSPSIFPFSNEKETCDLNESNSSSFTESPPTGSSSSPAGIPAPSVVSAALQVLPGKVLVPAVVDQVQGQALSALQVLKVIEADVKPGDLCIRREYARWLVSASSTLTRSTMSKVYPAMYIENVTDLAFDDITPEDPDFSSIQGNPLSRQDLVSWKMALEKRQLPEANKKILYQLSGFIDIDKINPDAWPALLADLTAGEQGIIALAFGCTRLFQPDKPVTNAQAAVALAIGEASDAVNEELQRIEAESAAENAVSEHSALVAEVEKEINESFEKELSMEREKIDVVEKMAEEARQELERLRAEREVDKIALMKERAAIESEMEILSKLRREVEEQLESLMSNKVEISYEKERINMLRKEAENENQEIARLQYELEVERKALSMARAWAEDEAKRAREQAKALEGARDRWERQGIKVVVDKDLREESDAAVMWVNAGKQFSVDQTVSRAQSLVDKLKAMANDVSGKSKEIINTIIHKILLFISNLKKWASKASMRAAELKDATILKAKGSVQELQQSTAEFRSNLTEGAKRVAGDCREGVEKLTQRFKT
ncbi:GPI-anchored adhesin-like protein [Citrus sinensis]|uniref:GPI-anchored adhesin-like protein n=1 Tax=Citrus sinensis TaxID=2711 RepID=A0ACB8HSN0_CITSI|nr:GPI-anchored adhesin-like protein [Citrus sinensis]